MKFNKVFHYFDIHYSFSAVVARATMAKSAFEILRFKIKWEVTNRR
jgi:hypothetical protein